MTAVFAARRRAEEFARLLDDPSPARVPADQRELLDVVTALRETPPVEPRPEFVGEPARPADERRGHPPRPGPRDRGHRPGDRPADAAPAAPPPRPPARRRRRRARPGRRHHVDGPGRPDGAAGRRPLPGEARDRGRPRPDQQRRRGHRRGPAPGRRGPAGRGLRAEPWRRGPRRLGGRGHPRHVQPPGRRRLRPAARRLRPARARVLDPRPARLRRHQPGPPHGAGDARARRRAATS